MLTRFVFVSLLLVASSGMWPGLVAAAPPTVPPELYWSEVDGELLWYYTNPGDFNQDSLITVSDITPCIRLLGTHFDQATSSYPADSIVYVADSDQNGLVTVSDMTALGAYFDRGVHAYQVYAGTSADYPDNGTLLATIDYVQATGDPRQVRLTYRYQLAAPVSGTSYWIKAVHDEQAGPASPPLEYTLPPPAEDGQIDIRLASDACGPGGTLAVRLFAPPAGSECFTAGAPVFVLVPGGKDSHAVEAGPVAGLESFINVSFSFPGVGLPPFDSDGVDDSRGPNVLIALRDVLRYCLGELKDTGGWTLQERTAANVLYDNVGVAALSNGGPLTMATLGTYGDQVSGLAWYMGWENPTCGQTVNGDAGPGNNEIAVIGGARQPFINPEYAGPLAATLDIDYGSISFDPFPLDPAMDVVFLNLGGLPHFDVIPHPISGFTADLDLNHAIEAGEDWGLGYWEVDGKRHYSEQAIAAIYANSVFTPGSEPVWLPTPAESAAFWQPRDSTYHYGNIGSKLPQLQVLLTFTEDDHVQTEPGHPHIRQAFFGFRVNGIDVKLNPSPATLIDLDPLLTGRTDLPDLPFNTEPAAWLSTDYCVPEDVHTNLTAAGVLELSGLVQGS